MKWNYESICLIEKDNNNSVLFKQLKFGQSLMKSYVMWLWLNEIKFDLTLNKRVEYLSQYYSISSENVVLNILNLEMNKEEQTILIYFYYLKDEEIEQIYELMDKAEDKTRKLYEEVKDTYYKQKSVLLKQIKDKRFIERLVNISFAEDIKIIPYISLMDEKQMGLHYEENKGVILALGYEFTLEKIQSYNHKEILNKLKALGDETRLNIVELILERYLSASELSKILDLTIPTIAHHLKVLVSAGIISSFIENEGGSKISYKIYNPGIDNLINNINLLRFGGAK